jgi:undecaprenyl-diphosphatase
LDQLAVFGAKYLFLLILLLAGAWAIRQRLPRVKRVVLFGAIIFTLAYIAAKIGGALYDDPRPFVVGHFTPLVPHEPDNGFPSDHVLLCSAVAAVVTMFQWPLGIVLWVMTAIVAICRVYVGIHHATDVIGSAAIVLAVALAARLVITKEGSTAAPTSAGEPPGANAN